MNHNFNVVSTHFSIHIFHNNRRRRFGVVQILARITRKPYAFTQSHRNCIFELWFWHESMRATVWYMVKNCVWFTFTDRSRIWEESIIWILCVYTYFAISTKKNVCQLLKISWTWVDAITGENSIAKFGICFMLFLSFFQKSTFK